MRRLCPPLLLVSTTLPHLHVTGHTYLDVPEGEHSHHHGGRGPALATEAAEDEAGARILGEGSPQGLEQSVKILGGETRGYVGRRFWLHTPYMARPLQTATPAAVPGHPEPGSRSGSQPGHSQLNSPHACKQPQPCVLSSLPQAPGPDM